MVEIDRIKTVAKARGLKLGKLCERLGEDQNYFNKVKLGLRRMDDGRIRYLADILGTSYEYLTGQSSEMDLHSNYYTFTVPEPPSVRVPQFDYDRFNERRIARHLTHDYIETQLQLPGDYWEDVRDGYRTADDQTINKLAVLLETTYDYLMGLTDDPRIPPDDKTGVKIKVFGDVAAGIPIQQIDNFDPDSPDDWEEIGRQTAKSGVYFALRIRGDSMSPRILDGDIVIVRNQNTIETGEIGVVAINGDTATCKKIVWDADGGMFLMSLNPSYAPRHFTAQEIRDKPVTILGKVVEFRGKP